MRRHAEDSLHKSIWQGLNVLLPHGHAVAWSVENRKCGVREGARRKARGCVAGVPDLHIVHNGRLLMIEIKTPHGTLSPAQKSFLDRAQACGVITSVCRSLEDVVAFLTAHNVPLKGSVQ